jgi:hypothetical protein
MKDPKDIAAAKAAKIKNPDWRLYSGWIPESVTEAPIEPEKRKPGRPRKVEEAPVEEVRPDGDGN